MLESGESVELDGSAVFDPSVERTVAAVVLRMPGASGGVVRPGAGGLHPDVLAVGADVVTSERGPAWVLVQALSAAGHVEPPAVELGRVTSARRRAAAVLVYRPDFAERAIAERASARPVLTETVDRRSCGRTGTAGHRVG